MGRTCCVIYCKSNSARRNEMKRLIFSFPRDEESKIMWLNAIGDKLKTKYRGKSDCNLFICEDHFKKESLRCGSHTVFTDGSLTHVPRKRITLRPDSVPSVFSNGPKDCELHVYPTYTDVARPKKPSEVKSQRSSAREMSPSSERKADIAYEIMEIQVSNPVKDLTVLSASVLPTETTVIKYSINNLMSDWNLRNLKTFPSFWEMNNHDNGALLFSYSGDVPCKVSRSILVKKDMTIEIRAYDYVSNYFILEMITCLEDLRSAMMTIVCLKLCAKAWTGACENGFFVYKPLSKANKCESCLIRTGLREEEKRRLIKRRVQAKKDRQTELLKSIKASFQFKTGKNKPYGRVLKKDRSVCS